MMNNRISGSFSITANSRLVTPNSRLVTFIIFLMPDNFIMASCM